MVKTEADKSRQEKKSYGMSAFVAVASDFESTLRGSLEHEVGMGTEVVREVGIKSKGIFGGFLIKLVCFFSVSLVLFTKVSALKFSGRTPELHQSCTG